MSAVYGRVQVYDNASDVKSMVRLVAQQVDKSVRDPWTRMYASEVVRGSQQYVMAGGPSEEDQIKRIFWHVKQNVLYVQDPRGYEYIPTARRVVQAGAEDCVTLDTPVVVRSRATGMYDVLSIGALEHVWPAYEALSYDFIKCEFVFSPISGWQNKGVKEVYESHTATGPSFRHTADHKAWWVDGRSKRIVERELGSALEEERNEFRRVLIARKIPALGLGDYSRDRAYLAGIYAAEGYAHDYHVAISQDREDVRERIESALRSVGAPFTPSARLRHAYYNILRSPEKDWLRSLGSNSFDMRMDPRVLSGSEDVIRTALEAHGDGDAYRPRVGTRWEGKVRAIHGTSSDGLAQDIQLMLMILGEAWYTQLQKRHGGVGTRPIHRIHRYLETNEPSRRTLEELPGCAYANIYDTTFVGEEVVADISVENTHNFVLGNGVILHNCDGHVVLVTSLLSVLGFAVGARVISQDGNNWHIYSLCGFDPIYAPTKFIALDTTQKESYPGWEPAPMLRRKQIDVGFHNGRAHLENGREI